MKLKSLNRIRQNKELKWFLTSAIVELCSLYVSIILLRAFYMTNDDRRMMYVLAGYWTGSPQTVYEFISVFLSPVINFMYKIMPGMAWYTYFQFFALFVGGVAVGRAIYKLCEGSHLHKILQIGMQFLFFFSVFAYSCNQLNFHVTASYWGVAGIATVLAIDSSKDSDRKILIQYIVSGALMILCLFQDRITALCCLCFYFVTVLYQLLHFIDIKNKKLLINNKKQLRRIVTFTGCLIVAFFGFWAIDEAVKQNASPEYEEYNDYRSAYYDYHKGNYDDDPETYEKIGWSRSFFQLTKSLYFMDDAFSTESLKSVVPKYSRMGSTGNKASAGQVLADIKDTVKSYSGFAAVVVMLCIGALSVFSSLSKRLYREFCGVCISVLGYAVFVYYLVSRGRFPLRVFFVVSLPLAVILLLFAIRSYLSCNTEKSLRGNAALVVAFLLAIMSFLGYQNIKGIHTDSVSEHDFNRAGKVLEMEMYASNHPENIYIYDVSLNSSSALSALPTGLNVTNTIYWGSSYMYSPAYYRQLSLLGLEKLDSESFKLDNVYFMSITNRNGSVISDSARLLLSFLNEKYGAVGIDVVDTIFSGSKCIGVYHFVFGEEISKNGFVKSNGITYYYKNGQKVTGLVDIKGSTYYFTEDNFTSPLEKYKFYVVNTFVDSEENEKNNVEVDEEKQNLYSLRFDIGAMYTGLITIDGKKYYFDDDGKMLKDGWLFSNNLYYYFGSDGVAYTGLVDINGKMAKFDQNGILRRYEGIISD